MVARYLRAAEAGAMGEWLQPNQPNLEATAMNVLTTYQSEIAAIADLFVIGSILVAFATWMYPRVTAAYLAALTQDRKLNPAEILASTTLAMSAFTVPSVPIILAAILIASPLIRFFAPANGLNIFFPGTIVVAVIFGFGCVIIGAIFGQTWRTITIHQYVGLTLGTTWSAFVLSLMLTPAFWRFDLEHYAISFGIYLSAALTGFFVGRKADIF